MASEVDICNLALAHLGDAAAVSSISPSDGSAQADHCARFYPIARDVCLEDMAPKWAIKRDDLAQLNAPPASWGYRYAAPSGCIKVLAVLAEDSADGDTTAAYTMEQTASGATTILTDTEKAQLRYVTRVTDTTKFQPLFTNAVSYLLASYLAGPVTKSESTAREMYSRYLTELGRAAVSDGRAQRTKGRDGHRPTWMAQR